MVFVDASTHARLCSAVWNDEKVPGAEDVMSTVSPAQKNAQKMSKYHSDVSTGDKAVEPRTNS